MRKRAEARTGTVAAPGLGARTDGLAPRYRWSLRSAHAPETLDILVAALLEHRGLRGAAAGAFLAPAYDGLPDPALLPQCAPAVARLQDALRRREPIAVFGDYDVDGITGTALLAEVLETIGGGVVSDLPHRDEGYGLSVGAVRRLVPPATVLVTVDNGTSATAAIAEAAARGADVIVIDHHTVNGALPAGALVVNPALPSSRYPAPPLAAVGVAWKVATALLAAEGHAGAEKYLLDLVALGTLADSMDLQGENRILVRWGLEVLRRTRRLGLRALADQAGVDLSSADTDAVTFRLVPRLNAAGRLRHADLALRLLRAPDEGTARRLAMELDTVNVERRLLTEEMLAEARQHLDPRTSSILFVSGPWPQGLLGVIAGRLAEEYHRPAVAVAVRDDECVASMRGDGINVVALVRETEVLLTRFGGHAGAAGFSFPTAALETVAQFFRSHPSLSTTPDAPELVVECPLSPRLLTTDLPRVLEPFEPFGAGNERPVFLLPSLSVIESRPVGANGDHLRFVFSHAAHPKAYPAVAFRWGTRPRPRAGDRVDVAARVRGDTFRGAPRVDLHVQDLRAST